MEPPAIKVSTGSRTEQASPENIATRSLISHWRRAEIGRVMYQAKVPEVRSSPRERIPASPAKPKPVIATGPNTIHSNRVSGRNTGGTGKSRKNARKAR